MISGRWEVDKAKKKNSCVSGSLPQKKGLVGRFYFFFFFLLFFLKLPLKNIIYSQENSMHLMLNLSTTSPIVRIFSTSNFSDEFSSVLQKDFTM